MNDKPRPKIHVVAGILRDAGGRVLIAQRPADKVLAGRWEFPGGKLDAGEAPYDGLVRELREELGIEVADADPFMKYDVDYPERRVTLDVWAVTSWSGEPRGLDSQALKWVDRAGLPAEDILEADAPIVQRLLSGA